MFSLPFYYVSIVARQRSRSIIVIANNDHKCFWKGTEATNLRNVSTALSCDLTLRKELHSLYLGYNTALPAPV